jgi:hypothetical protein
VLANTPRNTETETNTNHQEADGGRATKSGRAGEREKRMTERSLPRPGCSCLARSAALKWNAGERRLAGGVWHRYACSQPHLSITKVVVDTTRNTIVSSRGAGCQRNKTARGCPRDGSRRAAAASGGIRRQKAAEERAARLRGGK